MYFVYELTFGDRIYIGCTNNIVRRKNQHNENSRKRKSKLGIFLNDNGIRLTLDDFNILSSFENRKEALEEERAIAKKNARCGINLLNDNFSPDCSRRGKNIGNTSKEYVVIDFVNHQLYEVKNLRQYCIKNNLDYKGMQSTTRKVHSYKNRYCVFHREDWEATDDKEKYLSGSFLQEVYDKNREDRIKRTQKEYEVRFPDGHVETIKNLDQFAREHGINSGNLHASYTKNKSAQGYQVIRRI